MKIIKNLQGSFLARRLSLSTLRSAPGEYGGQAHSGKANNGKATSGQMANKEHWFWASLAVSVVSLIVSWNLGEESIRAWNQPRVYEVKGGLNKSAVGEIEYAQAAEVLRGLIAHADNGQSVLTVQASASGITLTGATPAAYEPFITALWQLPGMLPNATWEFDEVCMGAGCAGGAVMAKAHAQKVSIVMDSN
jgi:hypothetical protein